MTLDIIPAKDIDYRSVEEICGYQLRLCKMFEQAGGLSYEPAGGKEIAIIRREGLMWLERVRRLIDEALGAPVQLHRRVEGISLKDFPELLGAYDIMYRVCHGGPCYNYLRDVRLKAVNRWLRGDKSLSQARVVLMLHEEIARDILSVEPRYVEFCSRVIGGWIEELQTAGRLSGMPLEEAYEVLAFLLKEDLFAYLSRASDKKNWIKAYALTEAEITRLSPRTLRAYQAFAHSAERLPQQLLQKKFA